MRVEAVRGGDAAARLARALAASAAMAGCRLTVEHVRTRSWSSATFVGEQVSVQAGLVPADVGREWLDGLGDTELPMRGHVAVSVSIDRVAPAADGLAASLTVLVLLDG